MGKKLLLSVFITAFVFSMQWAGLSEVSAGNTTRVSVASDGTQGNNSSHGTSISSNGRYVAFASLASNLVFSDTNLYVDVFVHDLQTGTTTLVSVASDGTQGNGGSQVPSISSHGQYVAFASSASNLVDGDTNGRSDVFVHDRQTGTTTRVSIASDGTQGNGNSHSASISSDGQYVAFVSFASNLVDGDTNGRSDVFVHDLQTGTTTLVSVASDGTQGNGNSYIPSISFYGRYVAFASLASNLVDGDTNGYEDVFVHDRQTGNTTRVSIASGGIQGNWTSTDPSISSDGQYVAFASSASNLVNGDTNGVDDVFVHDRQTGNTTRVSVASDGTQGNGNSYIPSISSNGQYVAFESWASNLVDSDTNSYVDIFVHDRLRATTTRVSVGSGGIQGNNWSNDPSISSGGRCVAFKSSASNLVFSDTNSYVDVFVNIEAFPPVPDIKANGLDGLVSINEGENLSVTIELDPGSYDCCNADWWLLLFYYNPFTGSCVPIPLGIFQAPLLNLPPVGILNTSGLPQGVFIFYFAVDMDANGIFDPAQLYSDLVVVLIQ